MAGLFSPGRIGGLEVPNRIIRAATHEGLAGERGEPTEAQLRLYRALVKGGVGLIITGYAGVQANGKSSLYRMTMIDSDALIPAHRAVVEGVHAAGGRIVLQIAHCGRQACGRDMVAPSAVRYAWYAERPREITEEEIREVVGNFGEAARRARAARYDGVEVHAAHGYLLSSLLSGASNRRGDAWGGSAENRFRIVGMTLRAVKEAAGGDYPVLLKLNSREGERNGIRPEECVAYAKMAEATGCCDAIEISAGTNANVLYMARGAFPVDAILKYYRPFCEYSRAEKIATKYCVAPVERLLAPRFVEGYNLDTAALVKRAVGVPVIACGGMRTRRFMEAAIAGRKADFVSLGRPLVNEPGLPNRMKKGGEAARCANCNICLVASDAMPLRCHRGELRAAKSRINRR